MPRIVILGCAGSGKTTLARRLGNRTGAPVICLDAMWQPHWAENDVPAFRELLKKAHATDNWISDGNFALATFDIRLPRATLVIWLEGSKSSCIWRAITRVFKPGEAHGIRRLGKVLAFNLETSTESTARGLKRRELPMAGRAGSQIDY
jgi:adenylate kinase family enzyme